MAFATPGKRCWSNPRPSLDRRCAPTRRA